MKKFTAEDGEVITAAEQAAGIVAGTGRTEYVGAMQVISVRMPQHTANRLQALAHKSGKSRNATICTFLDVAIEEVEKCLSKEVLREVDEIEAGFSLGALQGED